MKLEERFPTEIESKNYFTDWIFRHYGIRCINTDTYSIYYPIDLIGYDRFNSIWSFELKVRYTTASWSKFGDNAILDSKYQFIQEHLNELGNVYLVGFFEEGMAWSDLRGKYKFTRYAMTPRTTKFNDHTMVKRLYYHYDFCSKYPYD